MAAEEDKIAHPLRICGKIIGGSVAEWLKAHDSKSCGQQCLGGSNPLASARKYKKEARRVSFLYFSVRRRRGVEPRFANARSR